MKVLLIYQHQFLSGTFKMIPTVFVYVSFEKIHV